MSKRHKQMQGWIAPVPYVDTPTNPWPDVSACELVEPGEKVAFINEGHKYFLQSEACAYDEYIISCSSCQKYWECIDKAKKSGDPSQVCLLTQAYDLLKQGNYDNSIPAREIIQRKQRVWENSTQRESEYVTEIRQMLCVYLDEFLAWKVEEPTYAQRMKRFESIVASKRSYKHQIRHACFRHLELWLLGTPASSNTSMCDDYADILRFLRHPEHHFAHVVATNIHGEKIADFLQEEYKRFSKHGELPVMSEAEIKLIPSVVPPYSGTLAHDYIEKRLLSVYNLPELREPEDVQHIEAMLHYLNRNGVEFRPENLERKVGSFVYKMCGKMDAMRQRNDGVYEIWDWKRTYDVHTWIERAKIKKRPDGTIDPHAYSIPFSDIPYSNSLVKYFLQAAAYRQLELLSHPDKVISTSAFLGVFHPSLECGFIVLELLLDTPMQSKAIKMWKNIGDVTTNEGELIECPRELTCIELFNCFLHQRFQHLVQHYGTNPLLKDIYKN